MSHQHLVTLGSLKVWLISPRVSRTIINRAERLISRIMADEIVFGMRPKVLKGNKQWLSYRINRKYRLLVRRTCNNTGPYYCLSHTEFDHWVHRH